jgi:hypothetical protein
MSTTGTNLSGIVKQWLLNLFGNALALASWYFWLLIPDAHGWQIALTAVQALLTVIFVLWLRAGTLAWFRAAEYRTQPAIGPAYRRGFRHIVPLAIWAAVFAVIAWIIISAGNVTPQFAVWIRQKVNAGPSPRNLLHGSDWLLFALLWIIVPAIWAPIATTIAAIGFSGSHIARSWRVLRRPLYWLLFCVLIALGAGAPYKLVTWVPDFSSLRAQAWSAGLRCAAAYLILITAFVLLVWMTGERTDREDPIAPVSDDATGKGRPSGHPPNATVSGRL